ncbi:hypothetical protein SAMN05444921_12676 [Streptomyces wuyuanensis]|uniref:Uncharacterized protein n=1 Tax=Streptomyces wuyuanensis TaxID=1196353 RepID=A0A1H0B678_9ACTN|nr:hypothetical protein SAMN05444921_12676 [Streptomyces wuyuanensis]
MPLEEDHRIKVQLDRLFAERGMTRPNWRCGSVSRWSTSPF